MEEIKLGKSGKVALVDDQYYDYLNQWKWHIQKSHGLMYAVRVSTENNERYFILMHRTIMNPIKDMQVDHIDHNGLNNQKANLRICTSQQNTSNRSKNKKGSPFKGVLYIKKKRGGKTYISIISRIRCNGIVYYLGAFKNIEDAAHAYDNKARELFGEYACLNFPQ